MWPTVTDQVAWSVCHDREPAKTAEPIEVPFGLWSRVGPRKHVLDWGSALWRNLANTIESSMCGDDAAFCQITSTTCYHHDHDHHHHHYYYILLES